MQFIFRIDDIYLDGNDFELHLFKLIEEYEVPITLGVIPFNKSEEPITNQLDEATKQFISKPYVEVALHGFKHVRNKKGEFAELPRQQQSDWIRRGRMQLEKLTQKPITTFIPPWNEYDVVTIEALQENGIKRLSAKQIKDLTIKHTKNIALLPYSVEHLFIFKTQFFKMIGYPFIAPCFASCFCLVLFHPYNFIEWQPKPAYFTEKKKHLLSNFFELQEIFIKLQNQKEHKVLTMADVNLSFRAPSFRPLGWLYYLIQRRILNFYRLAANSETKNT